MNLSKNDCMALFRRHCNIMYLREIVFGPPVAAVLSRLSSVARNGPGHPSGEQTSWGFAPSYIFPRGRVLTYVLHGDPLRNREASPDAASAVTQTRKSFCSNNAEVSARRRLDCVRFVCTLCDSARILGNGGTPRISNVLALRRAQKQTSIFLHET